MQTPAAGAFAVVGQPDAVAALGQVLRRQVAPALSVWGVAHVAGVDLRVAAPAMHIAEDRSMHPARIGAAVLAAAPPSTQLRLHAAGRDAELAYVRGVLEVAGISEAWLDGECQGLSTCAWIRLRLAVAAKTRASVVVIDGAFLEALGPEQPGVLQAVAQVAAHSLVLVLGSADRLSFPLLELPDVPDSRALASKEVLASHHLPGFRWVLPGLLAGMARPGTGLCSLQEDAASLLRLGASVIVTLEELPTHREVLTAVGLTAWHLPIVDMKAPSLAEALVIARRAADEIALGRLVVFHCKGGVGRTGTMLACTLIARGLGWQHALELVRQQNPHYLQTQAQLEFLPELEKSRS